MKRSITLITLLFILLTVVPVNAQAPVVRAVLFYSPFCGHCHKVINEDIPPLSAEHNQEVIWSQVSEPEGQETSEIPPLVALEGDALQILFVNTVTPLGNELFASAIEAYEIPEPVGVPTLIVGEQYMIGSADIPAQFPTIVSDGLSEGGIDWPDIPGLTEGLIQLTPFDEQPSESTDLATDIPATQENAVEDPIVSTDPAAEDDLSAGSNPVPIQLEGGELTIRERVLQDPVGNTLSIIVLIGMALSVIGVAARWGSDTKQLRSRKLPWYALLLLLIGIGVAAYLSFVETSGTEAVCGPVGDCNTVQQSAYATLFGLIPIGILGLAGYASLLLAWFVSGLENRRYANLAKILFFSLALAGTLFSIYLTFLEPFVIGATCMWCLSSAVIMTLLLILSTDTARVAFTDLRK